jgi:broad specificity phosphatase PhoE
MVCCVEYNQSLTQQNTRLIRHGETEYNAIKRIQGQLDVALNDTGLKQAQLVATSIANHYPKDKLAQKFHTTIYSSDLKRAAVTAQTIRNELCSVTENENLFQLVTDARLREINFGDKLSGTYFGEHKGIFNSSKPELKIGGDDNPNAESYVDLQDRFNECIEEICLQYAKDTAVTNTNGAILVASHGGGIRAQICKWMGLPLKSMRMLQVYNTSIHRVAVYVNRNAAIQSGKLKITKKEIIELNNTSHLRQNDGYLDSE